MDAAYTAPLTTRRGTGAAPGSMDDAAETTDSPYDPGYGMSEEVHPLDGLENDPSDHTTAVPVVAAGRKTRSVGSNRHLTSLVLALVAVPAGYGFLDYFFYRADKLAQTGDPGQFPDRLLIMMGAAASCFLVAALAGRISALGPLVAGLVWGAAPAAWVVLDYASFVDRLNDLPEFWPNTGFGLAAAGFAVFPAVAGLLIGVAFAGKWRRPVAVSRW